MAPIKNRSSNNDNNREISSKTKCATSTVKKVSNPTDITKKKAELKLKKSISSRSMPTITKTTFIGNLKAYTYYFKEYLKSALFRTWRESRQIETKKPRRPFRTTCRNYIDKLYKMTESTAQEVFSKILEQNNWSDNNDPKKLELQIILFIKDTVKHLMDLDKFSQLVRNRDVNLPDLTQATIDSKRCCYILLTIYLNLVERGTDNISNINQLWCLLKPLTMEIMNSTYEIIIDKMAAIVRDADAIYNYFLEVKRTEKIK